MARTVESAFTDYLACLTPTGTESEAARRHRASLRECLERSFGILDFYPCGSFGNGTSVSGFSDVDYMVCIPHEHNESSSSDLLDKVTRVLRFRFPQTGVRVDCPAVKVPFGTEAKENTEVVPGQFYGSTQGNYRIYHIADGNGHWIQTCPAAHKDYIRDLDKRLDGRMRPLVRFLKSWKYRNAVPISSFYLEMFVATYTSMQSTIIYPMDIEIMLGRLSEGFRTVSDPLGISGSIYPCPSTTWSSVVAPQVATAYTRAQMANRARSEGDAKTSIESWERVFNGYFSSYTP